MSNRAWLGAYRKVVREQGITQENAYNMDESRILDWNNGIESKYPWLCTSHKHQANPGHQKWVSKVECICVDGTAIPPIKIFKSKDVLQNWIPNNILDKALFSEYEG
jgi:hypothetical protein